MSVPTCSQCKRAIYGAKVVIKERFVCSECAYYLDKGQQPPQAVRK